jgi:hypothetical protein
MIRYNDSMLNNGKGIHSEWKKDGELTREAQE